jgi:hypothetical protein
MLLPLSSGLPIMVSMAIEASFFPSSPRRDAIPRLSKAGMPSRSEGWGGLFKVEQYRLIRSASRLSIRWLRGFEQTTPGASRPPLLTKEGNGAEPHLSISASRHTPFRPVTLIPNGITK